MKKIATLLVMCMPLLINAQKTKEDYRYDSVSSGIKFIQNLTWEQIKEKAKAQNKYIFMDCFATWCAPCRRMDRDVFVKDSVGNYINNKFISLKVQMDTSNQDNEEVKKWYITAQLIQKQYKVTALPTYLFFDADGKIMHKDIGAKTTVEFLSTINDVIKPEKQYYTLMNNYLGGGRDYNNMDYLSRFAKYLGDEKIAGSISDDYIKNYLLKLNTELLFTKKNIEFINLFTQSSKGEGFEFFYRHADEIGNMMNNKNYARNKIDIVITKEEIQPVFERYINMKISKPDWNKMTLTIRRKYSSSYAERLVINAKLRWYTYKGDWPNLCELYIKKKEIFGLFEDGNMNEVNNFVFDYIFMHSDNKKTINKAIKWMEIILRNVKLNEFAVAPYMDTYANLLYKAGRTNEAIAWETKTVQIANDYSDKRWVLIYQSMLNKMKNGKVTWK